MAVDMYQVILGGIAVAIMVLVPILSVLLYDLLVGRWDEGIQRWRERRWSAAEHRRAVRELRHQQGAPIEQLAADLRRLRAILGTDAHRSAAHQMGNRLAYDKLLMQVCEMLEIEHDLEHDSIGFERDIERIRVEAELEGAGLILSDRRFGQAA
jgi:biopolymer transport protein ExbB/TolQ